MQVSPVVISGFFLLQGVLGNPLSPRGVTKLRPDGATDPPPCSQPVCVPKQSAAANSEVDVYPQIVDGRSTKQSRQISPSRMAISYLFTYSRIPM
ncbi:hypothetical protein PSTT_11670 [Puccinia striiformis]|uniref:Secreted protein n=1 Tax=Puccinia striiformis TaxID=27350 RepID=A0A2S4UZ93_9BASI|nr:hypothetical protein PSTT_11670 [Puccinia striiformis]